MSEHFNSGHWNKAALHHAGYRPGAIIRVNMKNFLTYDNCEVFPGPKLNVVLGPNGTGKSTVTHAICLACGGEPKVLGRSSELSQFVKHGKQGDEAFAEVDILDENTVHTIRRTINSEKNSSKWTINSANATKDQVKVILKKLKIDVDNLCSFMSQDKVGQFTQQTPEGILKMTLQCITVKDSDRTLFDEQMELAGIETTKRDQERDLNAKQATFDKKQSELNRLELEVANVRQRQEKKILLKKYEVKKVVIQAKADRDKLNAKKEEWDKAEAERAEEEKKIAPLEKDESKAKLRLSQHDANVKTLIKKFSDSDKDAGNIRERVREKLEETQEAIMELGKLEETRKTQEKRIAEGRVKVQRIEAEYQKAVSSVPEINDKISKLSDAIRIEKDAEAALAEEDNEIQNELRQLSDEKGALQSRIQRLEGSSGVFHTKLKKWAEQNHSYALLQHALKVFQLVSNNKEKWKQENKLKNDIIGPVAMYMQVEDETCAIILEKAIRHNFLLTYIITSADDEQFFKQQLNKNNLKADLYNISNITNEESKRPYKASYLERFKALGFQGYMGDTFVTNDLVRGFLADRSKIPRSLWCRGPVSNISEEKIREMCGNESLTVYVHDPSMGVITEYGLSKSRYEPTKPAVISTIELKMQMNILGRVEVDNTAQKKQLEGDMKALKERIGVLETASRTIKEKQRKASGPLSAKRSDLTNLKKCLQLPVQKERELKAQKESLRKLESEYTVDAEQDKRNYLRQYQQNFNEALEHVKKLVEYGDVGMQAQLEKTVADESRNSLRQQLDSMTQLVRDAKRALDSFASNVSTKKKDFEDFKKVKEASEARATEIVMELGHGNADAFKAEYAKLSKDTADASTLEEINDKIETLTAEIDSGVDNEGLLVHYNKLLKDVDFEKRELEQLQHAFSHAEESLGTRLAEWKARVFAVSEKVNGSFSAYMKKLQYEGQVELRDLGNIDQYAMQMKVSFRINTKLSDLDGSRHSGGERAVSTIMYLMALQELTSAPFRVVDEINQGMDERNERLVFDRIVDSCCGDEKNPQYFLVSPKLLQGLRRMENKDVTVLLILNGPGVPSALPCIQDVIEHVKDAKRRRLG